MGSSVARHTDSITPCKDGTSVFKDCSRGHTDCRSSAARLEGTSAHNLAQGFPDFVNKLNIHFPK
jgi:hypothetical protein